MDLRPAVRHEWDVSPREAIELQKELVDRVEERTLEGPVRTVAGLDVSVRDDRVQAAAAVVELDGDEVDGVIDSAVWRGPVAFPYVPGLLSFREMPALIPLIDRLEVRPDVFMTDSHGRAHPRRFGLACHLGVWFDVPVLGVAKSRLVGSFREPAVEKGAHSWLYDGEDEREVIGAVVRTRTEVNPVFVSVGHRMTLTDAVELTLRATTRYKIPAPTRQAHLLSRREEE